MELKYKKNVKVVVDLEIGEEIIVKDYGITLNGKHIIEDIKPSFGLCESGIMVKISGHYLDSGWITKINP